jgi:hypothetical protein
VIDWRAIAPDAPHVHVVHAADADVYRVEHLPSGGRVEVPGAAVRARLRAANAAPDWPAQRRAALALAHAFARRAVAADALARRLAGRQLPGPRR